MKGTALSPYISSNWTLAWTYTLPKADTCWNNYDLCTCDANSDSVDDLIVSWGRTTLSSSNAVASQTKLSEENTVASASVLLLGGKIKMLQTSSDISYGDDPLCRVAFTTGDLNGDGIKEIILGGQVLTEAIQSNTTRCLAIYTYDSDKQKLTTTSIIDKKVVEDGNGYDTKYMSMPSMKANLAVAGIYGAGKNVCVYLDSVLYEYSNNTFEIADELENADTKNSDQVTITHPLYTSVTYSEYNANGSNLAGSSNAGIMLERIDTGDSVKITDLLHAKYATGINENKKADLTISNENIGVNAKGLESSSVNGSFATLVDTDQDSTVMRYTGKHYLTYSEPKILAVMASSPYFKDVAENADGGDDMLGSCETAFGKSTGTEEESASEVDIDVGYYREFTIGADLPVSITWYKGLGLSFTDSTSNSSGVEYSVTYSTIAGTDCVALYSIPEAVYEYEVEYTDTDGTVKTKTLTVEIPYQPVTQTITLDTYNKIQANYEDRLPEISGKVINSTPGDPSSYPSSSSGYHNAYVYNGDWAGTAYNSEGSVSQEISVSKSHSEEFSWGVYHSDTFVVGTDEYKGGASIDVSLSFLSGSTTSNGIDASGTVANMPEEAEQYGYYFAWKLMTYEYKLNKNESFPVVTYLTRDVTTPPSVPEDFTQDMDNTTDTQIGLSWTYSDDASSFDIYRKSKFTEGESNIKVGTVKAGDYTLQKNSDGELVYDEDGNTIKEYSFIEENLSPYTEYEYSLQVNRAKIPPQSIPTASLTTRTKAKYQPELKISDEELTLYPDSVKTVTVTALDSDEFTYNNKSYQWQKYDKKTDTWTDIAGKKSAKYKFANATIDDAGEYRCRLNTEISAGGSVFSISAYTKTLTVEFSKRDIQFGDVTYKEDGTSTTFTIGITNCGDGTKLQPSGAIVFTLSDGTNQTLKTSAIDVTNNTASVTFTDLDSGAYELSTEYIGQSSIFKDRKNDDAFVYMKDITNGIWVSSQSTYVYHENIMDSLKLYSLKMGSDGKATKTEISDQISRIEIYPYSDSTQSCAQFDITSRKMAFIPTADTTKLYGDDQLYSQIAKLVKDQKANIKIYYTDESGDSQNTTKTVYVKKADITLYLDDIEGDITTDTDDSGTETKDISLTIGSKTVSLSDIQKGNYNILENVKVKGDGYEEGDCPFTYESQSGMSQPDIFTDTIGDGHYNLGIYTASSDLVGNVLSSSISGETQITADGMLPGKYVLKLRCGDDYDGWDELSNYYNISIDSSSFVAYGDTYTVNAKAASCNGKQVGSITLVSPDKTDDVTGMKYQGGTTLTLKAVPISDYYVESWQIEESGTTRTVSADSDKLVYTVQGTSSTINITARFALKENHFTYKAIGGGTVACENAGSESGSEEQLTDDMIVISGRELTFKATPETGYEFVEWRRVIVGKSTTVSKGTTNADGTNTATFTMESASTVLYAIFQRQKADLTLSDHLVAYYINTSDIDSNVADGLELKVNNDNQVAKGATVIIRPEAGYKVSNWSVTGDSSIDYEEIEGDTAIQFTVPDEGDQVQVNATAVAGVYALSIETESTDSSTSSDDAPASLEITLNGTEVSQDSESLDRVTAGTALEVTAKPVRGYVFDHWKVNNKVIEGTSLVYAANVTKNMQIVAVCKPVASYTVQNQLVFTTTHSGSSYGGNNEKVIATVYDTYGEIVETASFKLSQSKTYNTVTLYEGEYVDYDIENGNLNRIEVYTIDGTGKEVDGTTLSNLTTSYQFKNEDNSNKSINFYFMPSLFYKVNIQNDTGYTLYEASDSSGKYDSPIGDAIYASPSELYPIYIVNSDGVLVSDVYAYLNGTAVKVSSGKINLNIGSENKESTLVITKTETCHITSADDLIAYMNKLSRISDSSYNAVNAILDADISLRDCYDLPGSGTSEEDEGVVLAGTFDGNGHTISGIPTVERATGGLFGKITKDGTVKNLKLSSFTLVMELQSTETYAGLITDENAGTIENCDIEYFRLHLIDDQIDADVDFLHMGVIAGKNTGTIRNCLTNECRMGNNETYDSPLYYGFIVSQNDGEIDTCYVRHSKEYIGDLIESDLLVQSGDGTVSDCYYDQGYLEDSKKTTNHGTSIWSSDTDRISSGKSAWKLNNAAADSSDVWGITSTDAEYPVLLNLGDKSGAEPKVPVIVSYTNYKDDYIYPGSTITLPEVDGNGNTVDAWTDGTSCYPAGSTVDSIMQNTTFTKADIDEVYVISVANDTTGSVQYFKTLADALSYANQTVTDSEGETVTVQVNKDVSLEKAATISQGVTFTLNSDNKVTVTIEDSASLTNKGTINLPVNTKMYNYGTFKNATTGTLEIGTKGSPLGTFTNSGTFRNSGTISEQTLIVCKPHTWSDVKVTKQPTSETAGKSTWTCEVCQATKEVVIPANDPNPDKSKITEIQISDPTYTDYVVEAAADSTATANAAKGIFDITGIKAVAVLTDGSTATVTNLTYTIDGNKIEAGDSLKDFIDEYKICDTEIVLTIRASDYNGVEGAEVTCKLTLTGDAAGHQTRQVEAVEATTTSDGNIAYYVCDRCGKYFDGDPDEDTTKEIEKDDVIITKESVEKSNAEEEAAKAAAEKEAAQKAAEEAAAAKEAAEKAAAAEKETTDTAAANTVLNKINQIGTVAYTSASKAKIDAARSAYNALTDDQKAKISADQLKVLTDAEKKYEELKKAVAEKAEQQKKAEAEKAAKAKAAAELKKAIQDVEKKYDVSKDTVAVSDTTLTARKSDKDVKGSTFAKLTLKSGKVKKNTIKVTWNKVTGADGYMIFANLCGSKNQLKKVKTVSKNTKTYTLKKLKAGKYYKFSVIAYKLVKGKKITIAVSKTIHEVTSGGKYGRITGVQVKKVGTVKSTKVTLKVKKTAKITAKEKYTKKKALHRKLSYESSNTKVATVSSSGKITAVKKGKCYIYVYAQNGTYTRVTVTVK